MSQLDRIAIIYLKNMTKGNNNMAICNECSKPSLGRIIASTRPGRANIYLDGEIVLDSSGGAAKTPTVVHNVTEGMHTVTFSKSGYSDITILVNVEIGSERYDYNARAVLDTSKWSYPMMLSQQPPVQQVTYGHMITSTTPEGAEIYIDGQPVLDVNGNIATTLSSVTGIITGIHTVTFKKAGYIEINTLVEIQNGLYSDIRATLRSETAQ